MRYMIEIFNIVRLMRFMIKTFIIFRLMRYRYIDIDRNLQYGSLDEIYYRNLQYSSLDEIYD